MFILTAFLAYGKCSNSYLLTHLQPCMKYGDFLEFSEIGGYPKWGVVFEMEGLNSSMNYVNMLSYC